MFVMYEIQLYLIEIKLNSRLFNYYLAKKMHHDILSLFNTFIHNPHYN